MNSSKKQFLCFVFIMMFFCSLAKAFNIEALVPDDSLRFKKFPKEAKIAFVQECKIINALISKIHVINHKLILTNFHERDMYVFSVYNTNTKKVENKFLFRGTGNEEAVAPLSSGLLNNETIWLHDFTLSKILYCKIPSKQYDTSIYIHKTISNFYYSVGVIDSNRVIGFNSYANIHKIQEVNLNNKAEKNLYGVFENKPNNFSDGSWKNANEGFIFLKPSKDKFVFASKLMDKFYIMDTLRKSSFKVEGPYHVKLNAEPAHINGLDVVITNAKTKRTYTNGYCTDKYIYLLYTNAYQMDLKSDSGNQIFVFDWNGKPVAKLNFDNLVSSFAIVDNDSTIYAFDSAKQQILKSKISF